MWLFPFFLCGIIFLNSINYYLLSAVIAALFLIVYIKKYKYIGVFCAAFFLLGITTAYMHTREFENKYIQLTKSEIYEGYIIDCDSDSYLIKNYKKNYKIILSQNKKINAYPGDYIIFSGIITNKPNYKKDIMNSQGIDAYITNNNNAIKIEPYNNILLFPVRLKYKINNALLSIDSEGGSFISGLITGSIKDLSADTLTAFQNLGISHILAVSGFNIGIIFYFMIIVTSKLNAKPRYLITLAVCFIYTAMGGFAPSIVRAFLMVFLVITSKLLNRFYDTISGITLAALIMLLINSFYIYNIGFLLSFFATYGIILLNKDVEDRLPKKLNCIKSEVSIGISAFIATFPLIIWFKGFFSVISILINIILSPFVGFATIFSFLSGFLYSIFSFKIILYPAVLIGVIFVKFVNFISKFNILIYPGVPSYIFIALYYILISIFFNYIPINLIKTKRKLTCIILSIILVLCLNYHNPSLKIHFINVGQGESIFIETPDKRGILIDTGPKLEDFSALRKRVIPYINRLGFYSLDILMFTHFHNDHAGDYPYLLDNYKVDKIIAYKKPENTKYKFIEVSRGDKIKVGDLLINILFPENIIAKAADTNDLNETCLVMEVKYKNFTMLLTGDAEKEIMDEIHGNYDVYNVQHHGSMKSFSTKMVDNSKIGLAVISVGKNNFGHPSMFVLNYLDKKNIKTYRTDLDGNITVITNGENYQTLFQ